MLLNPSKNLNVWLPFTIESGVIMLIYFKFVKTRFFKFISILTISLDLTNSSIQSLSLLLTKPENYLRSLNPALQTYKPTWAEWKKRETTDKHISVLPFRNFISLYPSLRMLTGCFIIVITQASHLSTSGTGCRMQRRSQISIEVFRFLKCKILLPASLFFGNEELPSPVRWLSLCNLLSLLNGLRCE